MKEYFNKWKKHIPNILTTLRLGAVPAFWFLTLTGNLLPATILFGSACITDALDGYLARRWKVQSIYGKITDPLADKMLVMSALLLHGITTNPLMLLPFALESGIAVVNIKDFVKDIDFKKIFKKDYIEYLVIKQKKANVSQTGREKTVALMSTVSLGLLNSGLNLPFKTIVNLLIMVTATMESATFVEYLDAKIINKSNSKIRLPDFIEQDDEQYNKNNKVVEEHRTVYKQELKRKEKIETLNKEKEFLLGKDNSKQNSKIKDFKK